ncbi:MULTISPECIES: reverse transcriptase domain-containing protein [Aerosakkonema]|uniref:reverse transcriptase domain-containing protein n=1 Tax=Aerosakkonema TaxID=1246629 RepID=UPI0035B6DAE8
MNTAIKPMYGWETIEWAKVQRQVFKLQKRIYRASIRGDVKTVRSLQRLLTKSWYAKLVAIRRVTQNNWEKKMFGVGGVAKLTNHQKINLAKKLRFNDKSQPARRVWINTLGKDEKKPLGILTIAERAKQALLKLALEPEWEARFEPNSYGFRPGRSYHDAIAAIYNSIVQETKYVLEARIEKRFDRIDHEKLLSKLQTTPTFRRQIKAWLKSGIMNAKEVFPTDEESLQGAVISPLLANIALHGLEDMLQKKFIKRIANDRKQKVTLVRYADDFVLMDECLEVVLEAKQLIEEWLMEMGLALKESQTRITHTFKKHDGNVGFDFLGFNVRQYPCRDKQSGWEGKTQSKRGHKTLIKPSKEAIERHLASVDELLAKNCKSSQIEVISALNSAIVRWAAYYSTVANSRTHKHMDNAMYQKLFAWAKRRRSKGRNNTKLVSNYWGVNRGLGWRFMTPDNQYILERYRDTKIEIYVKVKGARSPYDGDLQYWSDRLSQHPTLGNVAVITSSERRYYC